MSDFFMFHHSENEYFRKSHVLSVGSVLAPLTRDDKEPRYRVYVSFIDGSVVQKEFLGEESGKESARFVLELMRKIES